MALYLSSDISTFINKQLELWPLAKNNFNNLDGIERKPFKVLGLKGYVQFNPARAVSNLAKVDSQSIKQRQCFLCSQNRPAEQITLDLIPGWKLLLNPYPILKNHLTIVGEKHLPQEFLPVPAVMMAAQLPEMTLFYNDDGAGASAPDHRHFQAVKKFDLPLIELIDNNFGNQDIINNLPFYLETGEVKVNSSCDLIRMSTKYSKYPLNAFFWLSSLNRIRYILIPRKTHRPTCYFADPPFRRAISPGAIDMAGILVTPIREDYDLISENEIMEIYNQVGF